jgi:HK97 gp10 family phage protein
MSSGLDVANEAAWLMAVQNGLADLEITGEDELAKLAGTISANMREGAPEMPAAQRAARQATPKGRQSTRRKPGKRTIRFKRGRDRRGFYIDVGPTAFELAFYEYGTSKQPARPFLRPAIERAISTWGKK